MCPYARSDTEKKQKSTTMRHRGQLFMRLEYISANNERLLWEEKCGDTYRGAYGYSKSRETFNCHCKRAWKIVSNSNIFIKSSSANPLLADQKTENPVRNSTVFKSNDGVRPSKVRPIQPSIRGIAHHSRYRIIPRRQQVLFDGSDVEEKKIFTCFPMKLALD